MYRNKRVRERVYTGTVPQRGPETVSRAKGVQTITIFLPNAIVLS